uniref:Lipoprotein n=1 Tax=Panagrolaimus sp. ES5 TaxID=591445 RepID=A0AC34FC43_9BILA
MKFGNLVIFLFLLGSCGSDGKPVAKVVKVVNKIDKKLLLPFTLGGLVTADLLVDMVDFVVELFKSDGVEDDDRK